MTTITSKDKAIAILMKEKNALEEDLQVEKARVLKEVQVVVDKVKEWAAKLVIQARIKMAKDVATVGPTCLNGI